MKEDAVEGLERSGSLAPLLLCVGIPVRPNFSVSSVHTELNERMHSVVMMQRRCCSGAHPHPALHEALVTQPELQAGQDPSEDAVLLLLDVLQFCTWMPGSFLTFSVARNQSTCVLVSLNQSDVTFVHPGAMKDQHPHLKRLKV